MLYNSAFNDTVTNPGRNSKLERKQSRYSSSNFRIWRIELIIPKYGANFEKGTRRAALQSAGRSQNSNAVDSWLDNTRQTSHANATGWEQKHSMKRQANLQPQTKKSSFRKITTLWHIQIRKTFQQMCYLPENGWKDEIKPSTSNAMEFKI